MPKLALVIGSGFGGFAFRPHNRSEDVEGLFLVGAGKHAAAGVPGVLSSARVIHSLVPNAP